MRTPLLTLLVSSCVFAAGGKAPAKAPAAAPAAAAAPAKAAPKIDPLGPAKDVLAQMNALYSALEYDQVIPIADAFIKREDITIEQRLDGYRLQGSAKAIVEDPVDAEKPFRLLLRARTDYELPSDTPPKILAVFRKVQTEERALANQLRDVQRAKIVANLKLLGDPPKEAKGGRALQFSFRLRDPTGSVETIRVPYRRSGQKTYSSLALERTEAGDWRGQIPGEVTADDNDYKMEYYVETADSAGPLLTMGNLTQPNLITVLAGQVPQERYKPIPRWAFFTALGATAALGAAAGATGVAYNNNQWLYSHGNISDGARLVKIANDGQTFATATNGLMIAAGTALIGTVVMATLTKFTEE